MEQTRAWRMELAAAALLLLLRTGAVRAQVAPAATPAPSAAVPVLPPAAEVPPASEALQPPTPLLAVPAPLPPLPSDAVSPPPGPPPASPGTSPAAQAMTNPALMGMGMGGMGGMGMGGMGMMGMGALGGRVPCVAAYQGADFFSAPVRDQNASLGYYRQNLTVLGPLWQEGKDALVGTAHVGVTSFNTDAILPDTHQPFPQDLWNVGLGANYRHPFDNGWLGNAGVTVGSQSDRPFNNFNVMSIGVNASVRVPSGDRNAWIFGMALSSNSQILPYVPIPTVAYFYSPSPTFLALVGFPFANVVWRPDPDWSVSATYALLTNFHSRVNYRLAPPVYLFAGIDFQNQNYFLDHRTDPNQRFYMYDDDVSTGVQFFLGRHAACNLSGGYAFGRRFFESTNGTSVSTNLVNVNPGAFAGASFQILY